jgi:hypothetical protein
MTARAHTTAAALVAIGTSCAFVACGNVDGVSSTESDVATVQAALTLGPTGHALDYFQCATEGGTCAIAGGKYLAYGAHGRYVYAFNGDGNFNDFTPCNTTKFGGIDPAPGFTKACYFANYANIFCDQGSSCASSTNYNWAYGLNGTFNFKALNGSFNCDDGTFGNPIAGSKTCFVALHAAYGPVGAEGSTLTGLSNTPVAYGANGRFLFAIASGSMDCTNAAFGSDPAPGVPKTCYQYRRSFVTDEGNSFDAGPSFARYFYGSGLNGNFIEKWVTGTVSCSSATFDGDPDFGHVKHCYR